MQRNKAILRNSKIVIFDKKNISTAAWVSFFPQPAGLERYFLHVGLNCIKELIL